MVSGLRAGRGTSPEDWEIASMTTRQSTQAQGPVRWAGAALGALSLVAAFPAHAVLGGSYNTVETDRLHMAAQVKTSAAASFSVHALTLANGAVVREFTRGDGTVFAVDWRGPGRPDLRQLLGTYFDTMQTDNVTPVGRRRMRRPLAVNRADLVIQTTGHSGAFQGVAILPKLAPAGFSATDLK
jgi:hypothetical protein